MSKRRAVVVGINKYEGEIPELKGAVHDATEMADILQADGDFEIAAGHLLINEAATFLAIRQAMSDLLWKSEPCDVSLFYFSGHGKEDGRGTGYLAPYDMLPDEPFVRGVSMHEFKSMVVGAMNKPGIIGLLDCCYSGHATEGDRPKSAEATLEIGHHFDNFPLGTGRTILASSGKDQKSREVSRNCDRVDGAAHEHGIFTYHLLQGLQGAAQNKDGNISLERLCSHVKEAMTTDTHASTLYQSSVSGDIILTTVGRQKRLETLLFEAENLYTEGQQNVLALFSAIDSYSKIVAYAPDLERAKDLQSRLDQSLMWYRREGQVWLSSKRVEIGGRYLLQYKFLSDGLRNLCVDEYRKLSAQRKELLSALCYVLQEDPNNYEDLMLAIEKDRNAPAPRQTPMMQAKGAGG